MRCRRTERQYLHGSLSRLDGKLSSLDWVCLISEWHTDWIIWMIGFLDTVLLYANSPPFDLSWHQDVGWEACCMLHFFRGMRISCWYLANHFSHENLQAGAGPLVQSNWAFLAPSLVARCCCGTSANFATLGGWWWIHLLQISRCLLLKKHILSIWCRGYRDLIEQQFLWNCCGFCCLQMDPP